MTHSATIHDAVHVLISDDRLSASILIDPNAAPHGVDIADLIATLDAAGVIGVSEQSLRALAGNKDRISARTPLVVLRGTAPVDGAAATLTFSDPAKLESTVARDTLVATITGGHPGTPGKDVQNKNIPPYRPKDPFTLGIGVALELDGSIRAMTPGRFTLYPDGTLAVLPKYEVFGDLSSTTLPKHAPPASTTSTPTPTPTTHHNSHPRAEWPGDLVVSGSVRDALTLDIAGSLIVSAAIEAELIEVGEDLTSSAGILGGGLHATRGRYIAGRDISARFATGARLESARDIHIDADLMHCRVTCGGHLHVHERIHGCVIIATAGITCYAATASAQQPTILEAGSDPVLRHLAETTLPNIEDHLQKVAHSKLTIAPLLARKDSLTPAQRQQAVRLIRETTRLEHEIADTTAPLRARYQHVQSSAIYEINVLDMLQAGVTIRFPGLEATIPTSFRGPLKILPDRTPGDPQILVIDQKTKSTHHLPARHLTDPITLHLHKVMSKIA